MEKTLIMTNKKAVHALMLLKKKRTFKKRQWKVSIIAVSITW